MSEVPLIWEIQTTATDIVWTIIPFAWAIVALIMFFGKSRDTHEKRSTQ